MKAWAHSVGRKFVIVIVSESNLFPGHRHTHPCAVTSMREVSAYCRKNALELQEGTCPLPRMPQGRYVRDDDAATTKQHVRTMMEK